MVATQLPLFLAWDFNKSFTDIVNSVIAGPPHYNGRVPHNFFIKKRTGLFPTLIPLVDEIFDTRFVDWDWYVLGYISDTDTVVWMKNNTIYKSVAYNADTVYKIIDLGWVKWTPIESGTAWEGTAATESVEEFFEDVTKTWVVDAYAGKWLYIYSAASWQGIVTQISSNTATKIFPVNWFVALPAWVTQYYIFDDYETIFWYNMSDGVYLSHHDDAAWQLKVQNITPANNVVVGGWRIFWYTEQGNLYVTNAGVNNLTLNLDNYYIGTQSNVLDLVDYKEYVILLSLDQIDIIKTQTLTIATGDTTVTETAFKLINATREFGEHNRWAYVVYNQGLYIVSRRGKFIAVNIAPVPLSSGYSGQDEFLVTQQDQWVNIQRHLDPYTFTATYRLSIDDDEINIVQTDPELAFTRILKYDFSYQWWHYWETSLPIKYIANRSTGYSYVWDNIYEPHATSLQDNGWIYYTQSVKIVLHEDNIFNTKRDIMIKFYIGYLMSKTTEVNFDTVLAGQLTRITKDFTDVEYLNHIELLWLWWENDNPILTYGSRGSMDETPSTVTSTALVEIPLWFQTDLFTVTLEAGTDDQIHMGWALLMYEMFDAQLTSKLNTI
jgi:hypothetical protein